MQLAQAHDWLDHAWGWSQVGGAVVAIVALIVALFSVFDARRSAEAASRSARAAERTAIAAEQTAADTKQAVGIAREELLMLKAEAARKPQLTLKTTVLDSRHPQSVVLRLEFGNDGDADAIGTGVNITVPAGSRVWDRESEKEETEDALPMHARTDELDGSPLEFAIKETNILRRRVTVGYVRIAFPSTGPVGVGIHAFHPLAEVEESIMVEVS